MMKRYLLPLLCAALLPAAAAAQTRLFVRHACAVDNAEMNQSHYVFDPSNEAQQIISAIMNANILDPNFIIRSGDVANALATFENGQRYIIYNTAYIERIKSSAGTDWAAFFVFAHEIGHHLNNHRFDLSDEGARKEQELRADVFAGGMLYRLGASLAEAQRGVEAVCKERETATHPPRRARLEAVANGWRRAKEQNPAQPERLRLDLGGVAAPVTAPATTPGEDDPLGLVLVRGGTFTMGCTSEQQDCNEDETPAHRVTVSDFYIGRHEVTQRIWAQIMGSNPSRFLNCDDCPVENVSWDDAQDFLKKLNARYPGKNYRLPTEAEWEYAARGGGQAVLFGNGKNMANPAEVNFEASDDFKTTYSQVGTPREKTIPVGSLNSPNALGLHDMSGNVWEWCSDWYDFYASEPQTNPNGAGIGSVRVIRGGAWHNAPWYSRVATRDYNAPDNRREDTGFRLARSR